MKLERVRVVPKYKFMFKYKFALNNVDYMELIYLAKCEKYNENSSLIRLWNFFIRLVFMKVSDWKTSSGLETG